SVSGSTPGSAHIVCECVTTVVGLDKALDDWERFASWATSGSEGPLRLSSSAEWLPPISRRRVPCVGCGTDLSPFFYSGRVTVGDRFHLYASGLSETRTSGSDGHLPAGLCWQAGRRRNWHDGQDWGCWRVAEASSGRRFMTGLFRTKPV